MDDSPNQAWRQDRDAAFLHQFEEQIGCDVHFKFGTDDGDSPRVTIGAHRFVLMAVSDVFATMLAPGMYIEGDGVVEIKEEDSEDFREMLRYVYSHKLSLEEEIAFKLVKFADKYMIPSLAKRCWQYLRESIGDEAELDRVLDIAVFYQEDQTINHCLKFLRYKDIDGEADYLQGFSNHVSFPTLKLIIEDRYLIEDETDIFTFAIRWAKEELEQNGTKETPESIREVLGDVLNLVRLPLLSVKDLTEEVIPSGLLSCEEECLLHRHLAGMQNLDLPFPKDKRSSLCTVREEPVRNHSVHFKFKHHVIFCGMVSYNLPYVYDEKIVKLSINDTRVRCRKERAHRNCDRLVLFRGDEFLVTANTNLQVFAKGDVKYTEPREMPVFSVSASPDENLVKSVFCETGKGQIGVLFKVPDDVE